MWANMYIPPIVNRIDSLLEGLEFNSSAVVLFPYLCGFETPITGRRSPWYDAFTEQTILQYEYDQNIRYWYRTGLEIHLEDNLTLPFLTDLVQVFINGSNATHQCQQPNRV